MKIKQIAVEDRPREKALKYGIEKLTDKELLALFIRSGVKGKSALEIAEDILAEIKNLHQLYIIEDQQLLKIKGISKLKLLEFQCIKEISRRITFDELKTGTTIHSAVILGEWLKHEIGFSHQENVVVVFLDIKNCIIHYKIIFKGTISSSVFHPREIFKEAMRYSASKIIIAHNHPSGDTTYSNADKQVTKQLIEAGKVCGIPVLDHVIVGKNNVFSFRENNILQFE